MRARRTTDESGKARKAGRAFIARLVKTSWARRAFFVLPGPGRETPGNTFLAPVLAARSREQAGQTNVAGRAFIACLVKTSWARRAFFFLTGTGRKTPGNTFLAPFLAARSRKQAGQTNVAARLIGETLRVAFRAFGATKHAEARGKLASITATTLLGPALAVRTAARFAHLALCDVLESLLL